MRKGERVRRTIVEAAIASIEADGLGRVTVRAIATRAGVNVSAISYYFGSKETLIAHVLENTLEHMLADVRDYLERLPSDPRSELEGLLTYLLEGSLTYPRLTQAHLHDAFIGGDYTGAFPRRFAAMLEELAEALGQVLVDRDRLARHRLAAQAFSSVMFPAFFGGLFHPSKLLTSKPKRKQYVAGVVRGLLDAQGH